MPIILRLLSYLRKYWIATTVAIISLLLAVAIELTVPELIRWVIDCGIRAGQDADSASARCPTDIDAIGVVARAALFVVGLTVLKGLFQFGHGYLGEYGAQGIAYDIRDELYKHLQRLSFSWHDRAQTGQLMARATSDVEQLRNFTGRAFMQLLQIVTMSVAIIVVLFAMNWKLAIVSILVLPLLIHTVSTYQKKVRPLFNQVQEELAVLASIVQENLAGAKVVKAFAREPDEIRRFDQQNDRLLAEYVAAARVQAFTNPFMDVVANLGTVIVLWYGGYLVIRGELTVGELVAFNAYLLLISRPIRRLGFLISQTARATAAAERIFEVLDAPVEVADKPGASPLPQVSGQVVFDAVSVAYYGGQRVLKDVSFEAKPGQVVALLGATGSGKSTIVNLIPRFYDVTEGRVLIDGYDVRDVQIQSLRRQIGMVLQDTTLFTGSIRENIAFGVPNATDEQVVAMAKAARAHDFILGFPRGYDTRVGERGVTLSGGQKQRVAIARALLLDPRILILDDFTSAVDTETESLIRQALNVLMEGRTTFVIAQRVSTVQNADQILVLDHGQIVGMGNHEELLESNPIYAEIYRLQLMDESVEEAFGAERAAELVGATAWRAAHPNDAGPGQHNTHEPSAGHTGSPINGAAANGHTTSGRNA
jgi:ABC-type multidrug transport system fused ATPase/permease subunit